MGKYLLGVIGILSLIWIIYVGVNITSTGPSLTPEHVFHKKGTVIVVHKPREIDYTEPAFQLLSDNAFYASLLQNPERVQHFYFSSEGTTVLLERSKPWTINLVNAYFQKLSVKTTFTSARVLQLSNGWNARFDKGYLLISQGETSLSEDSPFNWNYVDRKSTASIVNMENGRAVIENCYQKANGLITYISAMDTQGRHLADDQDLFLDIVPESFREYTFYEKNYLRSIDPSSSPAYEWMNNGLVVIRSGKDRCIVTDFITGQDPIAILGDAIDETTLTEAKTSGFIRNVQLPQSILPAKNWYIEVFNNRVFIAENKASIDAFIGAYESGRTLSQNIGKYAGLFSSNPKKVSYRHLSPQEHRTISLLNNSRHTVLKKYSNEPETAEETADNQLEPIRIDGGIAQLIPVQGSDFVYVISKTMIVYGINKTGERWKIQLNEPLIGEAALSGTGSELLLTTAGAIHIIGKNGGEINGFPLTLSSKPTAPACYYSWKGKEQLAVADNQFLTIYQQGKKVSAIKLPFAARETAFIVWVNGGELTATIAGESKGVNISIDRKRKGKEFALPTGGLVPVKTSEGAYFFGTADNRFFSISSKGERKELASGASKIVGITKDAQQTILLVQAGNSVKAFSDNGNALGTITTAFSEAESASCIRSSSGKTVVGILDGLSNNNYIYSLNGKQLTDQSFEGATMIVLHRQQNGTLLLLSQSNGYLVRYPVE